MAEDNSAVQAFSEDIESKARSFGKGKYGKILKTAHTPSREEHKKTMMITALGIILIGALGFAIWWLMTYLPTYF
jgi:protein transport protein SEC61 subunit gamma-like protein